MPELVAWRTETPGITQYLPPRRRLTIGLGEPAPGQPARRVGQPGTMSWKITRALLVLDEKEAEEVMGINLDDIPAGVVRVELTFKILDL